MVPTPQGIVRFVGKLLVPVVSFGKSLRLAELQETSSSLVALTLNRDAQKFN